MTDRKIQYQTAHFNGIAGEDHVKRGQAAKETGEGATQSKPELG